MKFCMVHLLRFQKLGLGCVAKFSAADASDETASGRLIGGLCMHSFTLPHKQSMDHGDIWWTAASCNFWARYLFGTVRARQHDYCTIMALKNALLKMCSNQSQDRINSEGSWELWQDRARALEMDFKSCTFLQAAERKHRWMTASLSSFPVLTWRCAALLDGRLKGVMHRKMTLRSLTPCLPGSVGSLIPSTATIFVYFPYSLWPGSWFQFPPCSQIGHCCSKGIDLDPIWFTLPSPFRDVCLALGCRLPRHSASPLVVQDLLLPFVLGVTSWLQCVSPEIPDPWSLRVWDTKVILKRDPLYNIHFFRTGINHECWPCRMVEGSSALKKRVFYLRQFGEVWVWVLFRGR